MAVFLLSIYKNVQIAYNYSEEINIQVNRRI